MLYETCPYWECSNVANKIIYQEVINMNVIDQFNQIVETLRYCPNDKYGICDGCHYESVKDCKAKIREDIQTVLEHLRASNE